MDKLEELLGELHEAVIKDLLRRVHEGTATAADLGVARAILKDNHINALPTQENPLGKLLESLPFPTLEAAAKDQHFN